MKALLRRVKNVVNDRCTRVLFYDQTLKKGYASLASFSKLFIMRRALVTAVAFPLSLVCWVFLVVLNLFIPVKIYRFERPQRPGTASLYIAKLEPLCRELQANGNKGFLVFIDASETTNLELLKLYASHFDLYLDDRRAFFRTILTLVPQNFLSNTLLRYSVYGSGWNLPMATTVGITELSEPPEIISKLRIEPFKYVLISHNSVAYLRELRPAAYLNENRFTNLDTAKEAISSIHDRGLKIIRVGVNSDQLPKAFEDLAIIDLSGKFRNDVQDLWLFKNCLVSWGINDNGAWHFAHKYNRPSLITNSYNVIRGFQCSYFTPQLIWDKNQHKLLSVSEMLSLRGSNGRVAEMSSKGLIYKENSWGQLLGAVNEILNYAEAHNKYTDSDYSLLARYEKILEVSGHQPRMKNHTQPCVSFLREHQDLLE